MSDVRIALAQLIGAVDAAGLVEYLQKRNLSLGGSLRDAVEWVRKISEERDAQAAEVERLRVALSRVNIAFEKTERDLLLKQNELEAEVECLRAENAALKENASATLYHEALRLKREVAELHARVDVVTADKNLAVLREAELEAENAELRERLQAEANINNRQCQALSSLKARLAWFEELDPVTRVGESVINDGGALAFECHAYATASGRRWSDVGSAERTHWHGVAVALCGYFGRRKPEQLGITLSDLETIPGKRSACAVERWAREHPKPGGT